MPVKLTRMKFRIVRMKTAVQFYAKLTKTKPKREKINRYEQFYDFETLIQEAVNNVETLEMTASSATNTADSVEDLF